MTIQRLAGLAICLAVIVAAGAGATAEGLYGSHEVLQLTLKAPLHEIFQQKDNDFERGGFLELPSGRVVPLTLSTFGKSRLEACPFPPLKISVLPEDASGTLFEGQETLRLVTHCGAGAGSDRYALLEYLVYRIYGVLAEPAVSVRLAKIHYRDTASGGRTQKAHAFLVEDIGLLARRHDLVWLDLRRQEISDLDPPELALIALFEYMVGNTDWSALRSAEGERCCHNVAVLGDDKGGPRYLLPFDFDQAGLVNAPYATPNKKLGIRRVTQRRYRGDCASNDHLPEAIAFLNLRQPDLHALFHDPSLPHPKARAAAWRYVEQFYEIINDPKKLDRQIKQYCRRPTADR